MDSEMNRELLLEVIAQLSTKRKNDRVPHIVHVHNRYQSRRKQRKFAAAVKAKERDNPGLYGFGYATQEEILTEVRKVRHVDNIWKILIELENCGFVRSMSKKYHLKEKGFEHWEAVQIQRSLESRKRFEEAEKLAHEQRLLLAAEAAVKAKAEAEANPDDPLSWLRMAEAMEAANRHEEAERCRKTAMDLMEKETL